MRGPAGIKPATRETRDNACYDCDEPAECHFLFVNITSDQLCSRHSGFISIYPVDFKSGLLSSTSCVMSHLGEEPHFQWTYYTLFGRMHQAMNQNGAKGLVDGL